METANRPQKGKFQHKGFTYQGKLTLIFAIMTVSVIMIFTFIMMTRQKDNLMQTFHRTIQVENQKNAMALSNIFETIKDLAAALVLNESIYDSLEDLPGIAGRTDLYSLETSQGIFKTMLISKLATMNQMEDMKLYSKKGSCAYVTRTRSGFEKDSYWEQSWFEDFIVNGKDWMFYLTEKEGEPKLFFYRTVRDVINGNLVGYLEIRFNFRSEIKEILGESSLGDANLYYLWEQNGEVITNGDQNAENLLAQNSLMQKFYTGDEEPEENNLYPLIWNREEYLFAVSSVQKSKFLLISGGPVTVLENQSREAVRLFGMILAVCTAAAVGISYLAAKGLSRNIQKLNYAMLEAEKNPEIQVEILSGDEIGMLGQSFNRMIRKLQKTYGELYQAELDLKEAQNLALQAQINPHFLYNSLETIDALSVCERTEDIGRIVQALSQVFRYAMEENRSVALREELGHVTQYLEIMRIRYENRFTYDIEANETLLDLRVPKIILQPLAENAIIHSLLKREGCGRLLVKVCRKEEYIRISVVDNGAGMTKEKVDQLMEKLKAGVDTANGRKHIGVQNVDKRLKYFFDTRYQMSIESNLNVETSFIIEIGRR